MTRSEEEEETFSKMSNRAASSMKNKRRRLRRRRLQLSFLKMIFRSPQLTLALQGTWPLFLIYNGQATEKAIGLCSRGIQGPKWCHSHSKRSELNCTGRRKPFSSASNQLSEVAFDNELIQFGSGKGCSKRWRRIETGSAFISNNLFS